MQSKEELQKAGNSSNFLNMTKEVGEMMVREHAESSTSGFRRSFLIISGEPLEGSVGTVFKSFGDAETLKCAIFATLKDNPDLTFVVMEAVSEALGHQNPHPINCHLSTVNESINE